MMNKYIFILIEMEKSVGTCWTLLERVGTALSVPTMLERGKRSKTLNAANGSGFWGLLEPLERLERKYVS